MKLVGAVCNLFLSFSGHYSFLCSFLVIRVLEMLSAVFCQVDMSVLDDWGRGKGRRAYVNALSRENDSLHVNSKASCHLTSVNLCVVSNKQLSMFFVFFVFFCLVNF